MIGFECVLNRLEAERNQIKHKLSRLHAANNVTRLRELRRAVGPHARQPDLHRHRHRRLAGCSPTTPKPRLPGSSASELRKIRDVLVRRVERSMDLQGSEFALFERATLLEAEVRKRTAQLEQALAELKRSHEALGEAKALAEAANLSKTRFLAAASHDLLQPLNAARLPGGPGETGPNNAVPLVANAETAFRSVERLLGALLDISKLDAGVMKAPGGRRCRSGRCCAGWWPVHALAERKVCRSGSYPPRRWSAPTPTCSPGRS